MLSQLFARSLLVALMLTALSGCHMTVGDLKPASTDTKLVGGTEVNSLMIVLANRWYSQHCQPVTSQKCYDTHKAILASIRTALPLMQVRNRGQVKVVMSDWADNLLLAGNDQEDKILKGWLP